MRRYHILAFIAVIFLFESAMGQANKMQSVSIDNPYQQDVSVDNVKGQIQSPNMEQSVITYLQQDYPYLFENASSIFLLKRTEGPFTIHYLFQQQYHGISVYNNFLKINLEIGPERRKK